MAEKLSWGEGTQVHRFKQAATPDCGDLRRTKGSPLTPNLTASHDTMMPFGLCLLPGDCHTGERKHSLGLDSLGLESRFSTI